MGPGVQIPQRPPLFAKPGLLVLSDFQHLIENLEKAPESYFADPSNLADVALGPRGATFLG
tara:strand:+ start:396 stop:578 length:183 start_codon:yes stop_codon:yes gene_type:complete